MPEYKIKPYEELDITDNFMFCKVFSNEDVAKDFLQDVLKIDIERISVVAEATSQEDPFRKSVRLDVLVREELVAAGGERRAGRYFDIELQMANTGELPKRARYYQGMCDLDALAKGADYEELQEQYILFICPDDIFHKGKPVYRFQNLEWGSPEISLGDLCYKNFYIFKKYSEIKDAATREYMQYFATKQSGSEKMDRIRRLVEKYRQDPAARKAYMTLEQEFNIRYKKGRAEGRAEGADSRNRALAKGFRDDGVSSEVIAKRTGLTPEEIKAL